MRATLLFVVLVLALMPRSTEAQRVQRRQGAFTDPARLASEMAGWITVCDRTKIYADCGILRNTVIKYRPELAGSIGSDNVSFGHFIFNTPVRACPKRMTLAGLSAEGEIIEVTRDAEPGELCLGNYMSLLCGNPIKSWSAEVKEAPVVVPPDSINVWYSKLILVSGRAVTDTMSVSLDRPTVVRFWPTLPPPKPNTILVPVLVEKTDTVKVGAPFPWLWVAGALVAGTATGLLLCEDDDEAGRPVNPQNGVVLFFRRLRKIEVGLKFALPNFSP
ncbi:MAG: hypothetical protein A2653_03010 [Candidatus Zambryskibacteria bacterium RIFCSPHIGHO2_01_FULL_43_25]|uniref:Uncharacterized protein n=1 Tax=Candidatus Zambryskibacteria bacterium RIFCSPLOWO2_01_FULL_45_21 TaxID=1802761 RepID=A0A1G2U0B2_9BACT|nr:MAG: hypothetical protein A2653_03010 [Candidatus Zambryskibacteria bacterium RIFCSPHIGHO2_01_FULL_43_25]OHB00328.1 MAG: hypothetical protein A3E94_03095 [Candidatus Zambryskibacteria bacterium RIFCSPHIGHO2_12_FULL_44_12b]OHB02976.1 MAG: hypothetical protein A3B14_00855 [Candidatus Zambryskibacteria bacterium RIFCSPLOWO2_01_FULL_45_21]